MDKYLYVYHGGAEPESPEEGEKMMQAWMDWMKGMGDSIVDMGAPVGMSTTVLSDGTVRSDGGSNPTSGYTIIQANSLEEAIAHAKNCPILDDSGSIEVAPFHSMDG